MMPGSVRAREHQVLGDRHVFDQREMLVHHADAERLGVPRARDGTCASPTTTRPRSGAIEAHDALDERALAGAVLAEQRVHAAGAELERHVV